MVHGHDYDTGSSKVAHNNHLADEKREDEDHTDLATMGAEKDERQGEEIRDDNCDTLVITSREIVS